MPEPLALLNGRFLPQSQAALALNDGGFVFGATITDLCRTFRHELYRPDDHVARFLAGCRYASLDVPAGDVLSSQARELARHNAALLDPGNELALVMFATPGPIGYYLGAPGGVGDAAPTVGMHTFPLPFARYRPLVERGADLAVPDVRQVPGACVDPRVKQRSRLHWWLADQEARRRRPGAQALLLDESGYVTETAAANFLVVRDGVVLSPPLESVLAGVSLGVLRRLCTRLGIVFEHRPLTLDACLTADEAMLTSTAYCVAGVSRVNDVQVPWPGPTFQRLLAAWNDEIGLDVHEQITTASRER